MFIMIKLHGFLSATNPLDQSARPIRSTSQIDVLTAGTESKTVQQVKLKA